MIMVSLINTILTLQQKGLGHCRFVRMLLNGSNSLAIIGINWVEVKKRSQLFHKKESGGKVDRTHFECSDEKHQDGDD